MDRNNGEAVTLERLYGQLASLYSLLHKIARYRREPTHENEQVALAFLQHTVLTRSLSIARAEAAALGLISRFEEMREKLENTVGGST